MQNDHVADYARYHLIDTEWVPQNVTQQLRVPECIAFLTSEAPFYA